MRIFVGFFSGVFAATMDAWVATAPATLATGVSGAHGCACVCVCVCVCVGVRVCVGGCRRGHIVLAVFPLGIRITFNPPLWHHF